MASTRERVALASLLALYLCVAALAFDPTLSLGGDDARYVALADALASGRGYRDLLRPGEPLHGFYPPLYPALLAPIRAIGGGLAACKALSVAAGAVALGFGYVLARRRLGAAGAIAFGAALALNPTLLDHSHQALSEASFLAFLLASLCFAERPGGRRRDAVLAIAFALCAYFTRSAGIALLVALPLAWWLEGRRAAALCAAGAGAVALAAWTLYSASVPKGGPGYFEVMLLVDPYDPGRGRLGLGGVVARTASNALAYARDALPALLAGRSGFGVLRVGAALGLLGLALAGGARGLRRPRALECFAGCYAGLLLAWSGSWANARYLLPLLPALLVFALAAIAALAGSRRPWLFAAAAALLVAIALPENARVVRRSQGCRALRARAGDLACYPAPWRAYFELARWSGANLPRDAVVVCRKPYHFSYHSGLHAEVYPFRADPAAQHAFFDAIGASHVVVDAVAKETSRYLVPALRALPQRFALVQRAESDGSSASLFAIRRVGADWAPERASAEGARSEAQPSVGR